MSKKPKPKKSQAKKEFDAIDRFVEIVKPFCDAPISFLQAGAYHLVSDLLGQFFEAPVLPNGRPNLWFLLSSIPGRFRRSSVARYVDFVRNRVLLNFYEKLDSAGKLQANPDPNTPQEEWYREMLGDTTIVDGSAEGITDHITDTPYLNGYRIANTEIGTVLGAPKEKGSWRLGVATLYSKLYYGEGGTMYLSKRGKKKKEKRVIRPGLYVTLFAGMQEPQIYLVPETIRQGLLRRIMFIYESIARRWKKPIKLNRGLLQSDLRDYADRMFEFMWKCYKKSKKGLLEISFKPQVIDEINEYSRRLDAELDADQSDLNIFKQSLWEHTSKLAMNRRIAKFELKEVISSNPTKSLVPGILVDMKDMKFAKEFITPIEKATVAIVDLIQIDKRVVYSDVVHTKKLMGYAVGKTRSLLTATWIAEKATGSGDRKKHRKALNVGVSKGWLKVVAEFNQQGKLSDKEYKFIKRGKGKVTPIVFKVTKKGREAL